MQDMVTVFDFAERGFPWWPVVFGCMAIAAATGVYIGRDRLMTNRQKETRLLLARIFVGAAVLWTTVTVYRVAAQYSELLNAVAAGEMRVRYGAVQDHKGFLSGGGIYESFCVQNYCFSYSDFIPSAGFNNMAAYGGPVRDGLIVRVHHAGNLIARLDVGRQEQ